MNPIRSTLPQPAPTAPARSAADARAAFFQAVRGAGATDPVQKPQPVAARPAPAPSSAPAAKATSAEPATPQRYLRPGSIIDIKV